MKKLLPLCFLLSINFTICHAQVVFDTIGAGSALEFNGNTSNYVDLGKFFKTLSFPFSVEAWVYPTSYPSVNAAIFSTDNDINYSGFQSFLNPGGQVYFIFGNDLAANPSGRMGYVSNNSLPLNTWAHIAMVCNSPTNVAIYINGVLQNIHRDDGTATITAIIHSSNGVAAIGEETSSNGIDIFDGQIDELRLWGEAISQTTIQTNMCKKISPNTVGLLDYWRADKADTSNTVYDYTANGINGTIIGSVPRTISDAPIGNLSTCLYTVNWNAAALSLGSISDDTLTVDQITGTPDGVQIYSVSSIPFYTEGLQAIDSNYFGVFCVNGTSPSYQATYHFALPDGFLNVNNVDSATLNQRTDATDTPWVQSSANLNIGQQTLVAQNEGSPREYILSLNKNTSPCNGVNIVNNPGFENYKVCPWLEDQLNLCDGWLNCTGAYDQNFSCGTPDYLNTCGSGHVQLPNTIYATVYPHSGNGAADYTTYDGGAEYREYLETFFTTPMVIGQTYTVSYYLTTGTNQNYDYHTNNEGVLFTMDTLHYCAQPITWYKPQYNDTNVFDTGGWKLFTFQFKADSAYRYIILGDFFTEAQSKIVKAHNTGNPYSQIYVDDVSVSLSSGNLNTSIIPAKDTICLGASVTVKASGGTSYLWSTSATTDSIIVTPNRDTVYTVTITSGSCVGKDASRIIVNTAPPLIILPQPPPIICATFQSVTLRVKNKGSDFTWSPSEGLSATTGDSVIANPSVSVTYTVSGIDSLGCLATGTEPVNILPIANTPAFIQHNDTLVSSAKTDNQWYRNDSLLLNDTSQYLIISILGNYYVEVNNEANGCSTSSDTVGITSLTGIEQLTIDRQKLVLYPNPSAGTITISFSNNIQDLKITNLLGQLIYETHPEEKQLNFILNSDGVYFATVTSNNETITEKIIVIR